MPDEDSTLVTQTQQSPTNQSWDDNSFMLDFWNGEATWEIDDSEEKSDMNFDINVENKEEKGSNTEAIINQELNQDDLFWETSDSDEHTENTDLWNIFADTESEKNDENDENDDFAINLNSDSENNSKQEQSNSEMFEENNELFDESDSNISNTSLEEKFNLENETEGEDSQDGQFWEMNEEISNFDQNQPENLPIDIQENNEKENPDFSIDMDWNTTISIEEDENILTGENDKLWDNEEVVISEAEDDKAEENVNISDKNIEGNNWNELSWEIEGGNDIGQLNSEPEIEKTGDDIGFSFDIDDSDETTVEDKIEENNNSSDLEEVFASDWDDAISNAEDAPESIESNDEINFNFSIDDQSNLNQEENQVDSQKDEDANESFQDLETGDIEEDMSNDLFWDNQSSENQGNEIINEENLKNDESQNGVSSETKNEDIFNNQDIFQDVPNEVVNLVDGELLPNDTTSLEGNVETDTSDENNKIQESSTNTDFVEKGNQINTQPDMINLLWWEPVDFSYEENATATQQTENNLENSQNYTENVKEETSINLEVSQDIPNNDKWDSIVEEKSGSDILQNTEAWNLQQNIDNSIANVDRNMEDQWTYTQNQNIKENTNENIVVNVASLNSPSNVSQINESIPNKPETWLVKSTLSLDEILDSELQSNPQFTDNSKAVPKNIAAKSWGSNGLLKIFAWIWVLIMAWLFVVLAFPSIITEKNVGNTENAEITVESESNRENSSNPSEYLGISEDIQPNNQWETNKDTEITPHHSSWPTKIEVIDDNEDSTYEDVPNDVSSTETSSTDVSNTETSNTEISPYNFIETEENDNIITEKEKNISVEDIQSKILSFKSQGEWYKKVGESESNEKIIKYASYIIRLCDEYQLQIDNWEWIDNEAFSSFETKVLWFISKIETNLGWRDEVEIVYTQVKFYDDEDKEATREYLENR